VKIKNIIIFCKNINIYFDLQINTTIFFKLTNTLQILPPYKGIQYFTIKIFH